MHQILHNNARKLMNKILHYYSHKNVHADRQLEIVHNTILNTETLFHRVSIFPKTLFKTEFSV